MPSNVEIVLLLGGKPLEEVRQCQRGIKCEIIIGAGGWAPAEPDSRCVDVEEVSPHVPGSVGDIQIGVQGREVPERSGLVEHRVQSRAPGSASQPQNQGVVVLVVLGLQVNVVEVLLSRYVEVARVPVVGVVRNGEVHEVVVARLAEDRQNQQQRAYDSLHFTNRIYNSRV